MTDTTIADNNGRGIIVENIRSMVHVQRTSVSNNNHVAGVHILGGAGDVNISESRIAFNKGDGVNISYAGGNQNVSHSSISSNSGFGFAVWFNDSKQSDYKVGTTVLLHSSQIFGQKWVATSASEVIFIFSKLEYRYHSFGLTLQK